MADKLYSNNIIELSSRKIEWINKPIDGDAFKNIVYQTGLLDNTTDAAYGNIVNAFQVGAKMADVTREEIDAKLETVYANTRTEITRLEGKMDTISATLVGKLDTIIKQSDTDQTYNRATRWVMVGIGVALAALIVGMATYGDAMFGRGMNVRDVVMSVIKEQATQAKKP